MTAEDIRAYWNVPELDLATSTLVVFEGDRLVANAEVARDYASVDIHPSVRGRGLGTALLPWAWERARALGSTRVGQSVSDRRTDAPPLFSAHGYEAKWTNWLLRMPIAELAEPSPPEGYTLRWMDYANDARATYAMIDAAFREFMADRTDDWASWDGFIGSHERFAPWASPIAVHDGRIVGAAIAFDYGTDADAWIQQLAVERAHRGKGVGAAIVHAAFARFAAQGLRERGPGDRLARQRARLLRARRVHRADERDLLGEGPLGLSGGRGIRTLEGVAPLHAFQACPFGRSGRPPRRSLRNAGAEPVGVQGYPRCANGRTIRSLGSNGEGLTCDGASRAS